MPLPDLNANPQGGARQRGASRSNKAALPTQAAPLHRNLTSGSGRGHALDSAPLKAQPKNERDARASVRASTRGFPCRRLKKAIRKIRNRRRIKIGQRVCRRTRRRKVRESRPATGSEKSPDPVGARDND